MPALILGLTEMFSVTRAPSYSVVSYFSPLNSKCLTSWNFHFALVLTMYFVFSILICCPSCLEPSPIIWSIFLLNALGFLPIWPTSSVTTITWRELVYIAGEIFRMTCSSQCFLFPQTFPQYFYWATASGSSL